MRIGRCMSAWSGNRVCYGVVSVSHFSFLFVSFSSFIVRVIGFHLINLNRRRCRYCENKNCIVIASLTHSPINHSTTSQLLTNMSSRITPRAIRSLTNTTTSPAIRQQLKATASKLEVCPLSPPQHHLNLHSPRPPPQPARQAPPHVPRPHPSLPPSAR